MESKNQLLSSKREILSDLDQNIHKETRKASRTDEKLSLLRKQTSSRSHENQSSIQQLHQRLIEGDNHRLSLTSKAERAESDVFKFEKEAEAEKHFQEEEKQVLSLLPA